MSRVHLLVRAGVAAGAAGGLCLLGLLGASGCRPAVVRAADVSGWEALAAQESAGAAATFRAELAENPTNHWVRLGFATALLTRQPRTAATVAEADAALGRLADAPDAPPELAALAAYLQARVPEVHAVQADLAEAATRYAAVAERFPGQRWGEMAALQRHRLALIHAPDPATALAAAAAWLPEVTHPSVRRDARLLLGNHVLREGGDRRLALQWLVAAWRDGIEQTRYHGHTAVQVARLAHEFGDTALARAAAEDFLTRHPRDPRRRLISELSISVSDED